jgi:hypothetical protein
MAISNPAMKQFGPLQTDLNLTLRLYFLDLE